MMAELIHRLRELAGPVARILARVLAGYLIGLGYASEETASQYLPEIEVILGFALWAFTEYLYSVAKKKGWAT